MTKTEQYMERAKIVVAGLAVIEGEDDFLVVNLNSPHYKSVFTKDGRLIITNMSQKSVDKVSKMLSKNMKYLV
jgi:hypothetical protein